MKEMKVNIKGNNEISKRKPQTCRKRTLSYSLSLIR